MAQSRSAPGLDVIIRRDASASPFGVLIAFGWQRPHSWPVDALEELAAARAEFTHQARIQFIEKHADGGVELGEREKNIRLRSFAMTPTNCNLSSSSFKLRHTRIVRLTSGA